MKKFFAFIKRKPVWITAAAIVAAAAVTCGVVAAVNSGKIPPQDESHPASDTAEVGAPASGTDEMSAAPEESAPEESIPEESIPEEPSAEEAPVASEQEEPETTSVILPEEPVRNPWMEGYVPTHPEPGEMDPALKREIQESYAKKCNKSFDDVAISGYCGTYNNCAVAYILLKNEIWTTDVNTTEIGDVTFIYGGGYSLTAYKNGEFIDLSAAHQNGWLTNKDLKDIYYYLKGRGPETPSAD